MNENLLLHWTRLEPGKYTTTDHLGGKWTIIYTDASLRDAKRYGLPRELKDLLRPRPAG